MFRPVFCGVHHVNIKKSVFQKKKYILVDDDSLYLQKGSSQLCLKVGDFHMLILTFQKVKKHQTEDRQAHPEQLRLTAFSRALLSAQPCFPFPWPSTLQPAFFSHPCFCLSLWSSGSLLLISNRLKCSLGSSREQHHHLGALSMHVSIRS